MPDLTISQKLDSIINSKTNIKQAIINKGQQVNDVLDTYAAAIENIQTGTPSEDLNTVLNTQDNLLNTQNITISNISNALSGKSIPGGSGDLSIDDIYDISNFDITKSQRLLDYVKVYPNTIDATNITVLDYLFQGCMYMQNVPTFTNLENSTLDGSVSGGALTLHYTFQNCRNLSNIDINIPNKTTMSGMTAAFYECQSVENINFISPNTLSEDQFGSSDFSQCFCNCYNLKNINVSNGYLLAYMCSQMFCDCHNLTNLSHITINLSYCYDMSGMFMNCYNLTNFPTIISESPSITSMDWTFSKCNNLTDNELNKILSNVNTDSVITLSCTFGGCVDLNTIPNQFNYDNIQLLDSCFLGVNLTKVNLSISNCTSLYSTFAYKSNYWINENYYEDLYPCNLQEITLTNCTNINRASYMCYGCYTLTNININNLSTNLSDMSGTFRDCTNLTQINFENCDFGNVTTLSEMFANCENLINCPSFNNLGSVMDCNQMFSNCVNLVNIPYINIKDSNYIQNMFMGCDNLSDNSLDTILQMAADRSFVGSWSELGITENQFNIMKNLPNFQNAVNNGWSNEYI